MTAGGRLIDSCEMTSSSRVVVDEDEPLDDVEMPEFAARRVTIRTDRDFTDDFRTVDLLGRGKFGEVKRCVERSTGREFAAKFIATPRPQDRKDVEHEIDMMRRLHHRRLVQLYEAFQSDREMCLVIEIIYGGELFDRAISEDFLLTEKACVCIIRQICEGLEFIHGQNIIHLDMKPENILCLSKTGNRVKIIDFGLARLYNPDVDARVLFGTPEFMAPEVVQYEPIHFATDMWSIGVICYVLLSGLSPFMGDDDTETLGNVIRGRYSFDFSEFDHVSTDARDIISRLLVTDKRKRLTATQCLKHPWLKRISRQPSPTLQQTKMQLKRYVYRRRWKKVIHAVVSLKRMGFDITTVARSSPNNVERDKSHLSVDANTNVHLAMLNSRSVSIPKSTSTNVVDNLISGLPGRACAVEAVGKGHVTNATTDVQRLPSRITRDDVENASNMRQHYRQQKHDETLSSKLPQRLQAVAFTSAAPATSNNHFIDTQSDCHHSHGDQANSLLSANAGKNSPMENNQVTTAGGHLHPGQLQQQPLRLEKRNMQPFSCSNTIVWTDKNQQADGEQFFYHQQRQKQQEQVVGLLQSVNHPCAVRPVSTEHGRVAGDQFVNDSLKLSRHHRQGNYHSRQQQLLQPEVETPNAQPPLSRPDGANTVEKGPPIDQQLLRHRHRNQPQHQERQKDVTRHNYTSLMTTMSSADFAHTTAGDTTLPRTRVQSSRRVPPTVPPSTNFLFPTHNNPVLRTATVSDGPPVERNSVTLLRGQIDRSNFHISTLPRVKLQTTNGDVPQGRTILSIPAGRVPLLNGLSHRSQGHHPAPPGSKSSRDRFQFFSRNELAAAAAAAQVMKNSSSGSSGAAQKQNSESKTNWFRRVLFK